MEFPLRLARGFDVRSDAKVNRDRILAAAEAVFTEAGAAGSTEDIAKRAGVGIGTVFRHFPTKQSLLEATLVRHFEQLTAYAQKLADAADPSAALRELVEAMVGGGAAKILMVGLLVEESGMTTAAIEAAGNLRAAVASLLGRAQAAGTVRADVSIDELYLLIRGLSQATAMAPAEPATLRRAVDIVLNGLAKG
jgi:AcrR family transcriptional regulator